MADMSGLDKEQIRRINEAIQQLAQRYKTLSLAAQRAAGILRQYECSQETQEDVEEHQRDEER